MAENVIASKACVLIANNLGEVTADYYRQFYQGKDEELIIRSVTELLSEVVGPVNAKNQLAAVNL